MNHKTDSSWLRFLPAIIASSILVSWEAASRTGLIEAIFFPPPSIIVAALIRRLSPGSIPRDLGLTLSRAGLGLFLGGSAGIILGMFMGWSWKVRMVLNPFVAGLYPIPKTALLPLFLVLLGIGEAPRIALTAFAAFFPLLVSTMQSVRSIEPLHLEAAANYGARGKALLLRVILPASLPGILGGARIAANTSLTIAITAEIVTLQGGLGASIWLAWQTMRTEDLYATLLLIAAVGLCMDAGLRALVRWLVPWAPAVRDESS